MLIDKTTVVKPLYETDKGAAFLGDSFKLMKLVPDNSVDLILTSPPFALTRQKEYGNKQEQEYLEFFMPFAKEFYVSSNLAVHWLLT